MANIMKYDETAASKVLSALDEAIQTIGGSSIPALKSARNSASTLEVGKVSSIADALSAAETTISKLEAFKRKVKSYMDDTRQFDLDAANLLRELLDEESDLLTSGSAADDDAVGGGDYEFNLGDLVFKNGYVYKDGVLIGRGGVLASAGGSDLKGERDVYYDFMLAEALGIVAKNIQNAPPDAQRLNLQNMLDFAKSTTKNGIFAISSAVEPYVKLYERDVREITKNGPTGLCSTWLACYLRSGGAKLPDNKLDSVWNYNKDGKTEKLFFDPTKQTYYMGSVTIESDSSLSSLENKNRAKDLLHQVLESETAGNLVAAQTATKDGKELTHMAGAISSGTGRIETSGFSTYDEAGEMQTRLQEDLYETYVQSRIDNGEEYKVVLHFALVE